MLSKQADNIMRILVHQQDSFMTYKKIAKMLGISERSVNNYMKEVSDYCEKEGYHLIRMRGKGIRLEAGMRADELIRTFSGKKVSYENRESRINYIVNTLINSKEPYTIDLFASELYVSKSTIRLDIDRANECCQKDHLSVSRVVGTGIKIEGSEFWKRKVLVHRYKKYPPEEYEEVNLIPDLRMEKEFYGRLMGQYRKSIVNGVIDCIQELEKRIGYQFNDYTFCMIAEYTSNQINRIKKDCLLEESMINRLTLVEEIADWADIFTKLLNRKFQLNINPREALYLYVMLLGAEVQNSSRIVNKKFLIEKEIRIEEVTDQMISYLSAIVGLDFKKDNLLRTSLALFLNSSLVRTKYGFEIKNPFLEEVKQTYSAIFSACMTVSKQYEQLVSVLPREDEISYMAILFSGSMIKNQKKINTAIIGSGGIGISQIVAQKIEAKVPEINVVSVLPSNAALSIKENQYDLVITTIPSLRIKHPNVVYSTLLVEDQDMYRIRKICQKIMERDLNKTSNITIRHLLKDELVLLEHKTMTKEEVLKKACDLLFEQGYVEDEFYQSVMEREEISASGLGGGMAVPHGVSAFVKKPAVVVIRTDDKVEWGEGAVDVIFLLALNFEDIESTRAFFAAFYEMTMQKESAKMIRSAQTKEEIKAILIYNS